MKVGTGLPLIILGATPSKRFEIISKYNKAAIIWDRSILLNWNLYSFSINGSTLSIDKTVIYKFFLLTLF